MNVRVQEGVRLQVADSVERKRKSKPVAKRFTRNLDNGWQALENRRTGSQNQALSTGLALKPAVLFTTVNVTGCA